MIYFLVADEAEVVKIGYTASDEGLQKRLVEVQVGCPFELRVGAIHPGRRDKEKRFHRLLQDDRVRGEWFKLSGRVKRAMMEGAVDLLHEDDALERYHAAGYVTRTTRAITAEGIGYILALEKRVASLGGNPENLLK